MIRTLGKVSRAKDDFYALEYELLHYNDDGIQTGKSVHRLYPCVINDPVEGWQNTETKPGDPKELKELLTKHRQQYWKDDVVFAYKSSIEKKYIESELSTIAMDSKDIEDILNSIS